MEIRWSLPAAEDLLGICEWAERDDPEQPDGLPKSSMTVAHSYEISQTSDGPADA